MTDVVAALIWDNDRFLACQRPAHKARGLLWEFVGGKVEPGETQQEALIRECREELDITVRVGDVFMELVHEYPDLTVRLILFNATIAEGIPKKLEHNDLRWITTGEIDRYNFCPADEEILAKLKTIDNGLQATLLSAADTRYHHFQCSLMPTVDPATVIGVRMPRLRVMARELENAGLQHAVLNGLPHKYYEENNIHAILISRMKDYSSAVAALDQFLPYVDNWATCDLMTVKAFSGCPGPLPDKVSQWLESGHTYTVRFAIGVLMKHYLGEHFTPDLAQMVAAVKSDAYYVNMMIAWYFATALAKQYNCAIQFLEQRKLDPWVHNKTIRKALESYRIDAATKEYLRTLIIKKEDSL